MSQSCAIANYCFHPALRSRYAKEPAVPKSNRSAIGFKLINGAGPRPRFTDFLPSCNSASEVETTLSGFPHAPSRLNLVVLANRRGAHHFPDCCL
jgi:hypothetical protein